MSTSHPVSVLAAGLFPTPLRTLRADGIALTMGDLNVVLADANGWLAAQPAPKEGSAAWYGFNNFRQFIASLDADSSVYSLERACHVLGWHISDQYGAYEELPTIAQFNERVRRIAKEIRQAE